ncbi:adhesin transport system outer membrane protein [Novosphingobium sp. PhB165]|uniref:TolC family protein n=1 Tax=Novosphingobium sp. PhB165 TaxID=2485105 RepID=UPI0010510A25|nr:TolC family protein [Novosphingobium sp. PhB165]TCM17068.1 adhesin transport system outer membrane protein [Novosphingobium sp. PhB165]
MILTFRTIAVVSAFLGLVIVAERAGAAPEQGAQGELSPVEAPQNDPPPPDEADPKIPRQLDLPTAVALTLGRHPEIARANAALARGQADLGAARSVWTPQLSYQANLGPHMLSDTNSSGVNENMSGPTVYLQQQVWDFGRSKGEIGAARSTTGQRWYEREATADQLAEQSALAFLEVRRFEMLAGAARTQLEDLGHLRELIGMRVHAGISDKSDLMLADVRVESARGDAIQAETSAAMARAALANLIGGMPQDLADAGPLISRFEPADEEPDYDKLPAVAAAGEAADAAAAKIGETKAERYPRLGVQLGYTRNNYTYNTRDNALTAVMTVTGNLYRRSDHYLIEAAEEDRRAAEAARDSTVIEARGRALSAQQEIRAGSARIGAYSRQEEQAVTATRIFLEEYKLGKRTLTELLNTQLEVYRASSARIAAEHDIMEARVRFENLCGTLRPSLGLPARLSDEEDMHG